MWGDPGCRQDTNCCLFKTLAFLLHALDDTNELSVLELAVQLRNEFVTCAEEVSLKLPGLHSMDVVNTCMIPHDLATAGHHQCVTLPAMALIPRLSCVRVVIFVFASSEARPSVSASGSAELEQTLVIAPPLLLGGDRSAANMFLAVNNEHMMPVDLSLIHI